MLRPVRGLINLLVFLYLILGVWCAALAGLLVVCAETHGGRAFGLAVLVFFPVPVLLWLTVFIGRKRLLRSVAAAMALVAAVSLTLSYILAPDGTGRVESGVSSHFTGVTHYRRLSASGLVPEIDQLKLGTCLIAMVDPVITSEKAVRIRRTFLAVYRDMENAGDFRNLGSVLGYTYQDLFSNRRPVGHFYEYVPTNRPGMRMPVVLFLHGSLGNFKGYLWVWKKFADANGFAIVAPTFGAGNWDMPGGKEAIESAGEYCARHSQMDATRIYLAGLSNGGKGVSRAAAAHPDKYAALIYVSPVMEPDILLQKAFGDAWRDRPVLVLHGVEDDRIPLAYVDGTGTELRRKGARVKTVYYPGEDHFLFFSSRDQVLKDIASWMESIREQ